MSRTRTFPVLLITLAVLSAGLVGAGVSQAAGPLTVKQVKSIAKGVVKSQGKKLTVKNSTNLAGRPASAYQDNALHFTAAVSTPTADVDVLLPLPPGKYFAAWSAYMVGMPGTGRAGCYLYNDHGPLDSTYTADDLSETGNATAAYSGAGYIESKAGEKIRLSCSGAGAFTTSAADPISITVIPLDVASTTVLTPGPPPMRPSTRP